MPALHLEVNWIGHGKENFPPVLREIANEIKKGKKEGGSSGSLWWTLREWV
jgi:hypothetical protein